MNGEAFRGSRVDLRFEPMRVVTRIDPLKELQKRSPSDGVHPLTFQMIKDILTPGRRYPISGIQLSLLIDYYTTDFSFNSIYFTIDRLNEMALLENCIDNLRRTMPAEQQAQFPIELTPVFKLSDLGLLTKEEQKLYLRAFIPSDNSADYDPVKIRKTLEKGRRKRDKIALKYNSARFLEKNKK